MKSLESIRTKSWLIIILTLAVPIAVAFWEYIQNSRSENRTEQRHNESLANNERLANLTLEAIRSSITLRRESTDVFPDVQVLSSVTRVELVRREDGRIVMSSKPKNPNNEVFAVLNRGRSIAKNVKFSWHDLRQPLEGEHLPSAQHSSTIFESLRKQDLAPGEDVVLTWLPENILRNGIDHAVSFDGHFTIYFSDHEDNHYYRTYT